MYRDSGDSKALWALSRLRRGREGGRDSICQGSFDLGTEGGSGLHNIRLIFA
jgi:hypothetical protein